MAQTRRTATTDGTLPRSCPASHVRRFAADESGATAIEYSLVAAGVGLAVATTVWSLGTELKKNFYDKLTTLF